MLCYSQGTLQLPTRNTLADVDAIYSFSTSFESPAVVRIPPPGVKFPVEGATKPTEDAAPTAVEDSASPSLDALPPATEALTNDEAAEPVEEPQLVQEKPEVAPSPPARAIASMPFLEGHSPALDHLGQYKFSTAFF